MTVFNWLNEITVKKTPSTQFEKEDWDGWNSYMVHRFLSMNKGYIDIVNLAQKFPPTDKEGLYNFYKCEGKSKASASPTTAQVAPPLLFYL